MFTVNVTVNERDTFSPGAAKSALALERLTARTGGKLKIGVRPQEPPKNASSAQSRSHGSRRRKKRARCPPRLHRNEDKPQREGRGGSVAGTLPVTPARRGRAEDKGARARIKTGEIHAARESPSIQETGSGVIKTRIHFSKRRDFLLRKMNTFYAFERLDAGNPLN